MHIEHQTAVDVLVLTLNQPAAGDPAAAWVDVLPDVAVLFGTPALTPEVVNPAAYAQTASSVYAVRIARASHHNTGTDLAAACAAAAALGRVRAAVEQHVAECPALAAKVLAAMTPQDDSPLPFPG